MIKDAFGDDKGHFLTAHESCKIKLNKEGIDGIRCDKIEGLADR